MKRADERLGAAGAGVPAALQLPQTPRGRGWRVYVDALEADTRIGLHAHEYAARQPVVLDASLVYCCDPYESTQELLDYEHYCTRIRGFLTEKPHTRLLENLALEIAALSFDGWPALEAITLSLYKPKIRLGARRVGVELDWTRADYEAWRAREAVRAALDRPLAAAGA